MVGLTLAKSYVVVLTRRVEVRVGKVSLHCPEVFPAWSSRGSDPPRQAMIQVTDLGKHRACGCGLGWEIILHTVVWDCGDVWVLVAGECSSTEGKIEA